MRLEHLFEENETNDELSEDVTVTLTESFFSTFTIIKAQEFSLGGNILKSDMSRFKWRTNGGVINVSSKVEKMEIDPIRVLCIIPRFSIQIFVSLMIFLLVLGKGRGRRQLHSIPNR